MAWRLNDILWALSTVRYFPLGVPGWARGQFVLVPWRLNDILWALSTGRYDPLGVWNSRILRKSIVGWGQTAPTMLDNHSAKTNAQSPESVIPSEAWESPGNMLRFSTAFQEIATGFALAMTAVDGRWIFWFGWASDQPGRRRHDAALQRDISNGFPVGRGLGPAVAPSTTTLSKSAHRLSSPSVIAKPEGLWQSVPPAALAAPPGSFGTGKKRIATSGFALLAMTEVVGGWLHRNRTPLQFFSARRIKPPPFFWKRGRCFFTVYRTARSWSGSFRPVRRWRSRAWHARSSWRW